MWVAAILLSVSRTSHADVTGPVVHVRGETHVSIHWQREVGATAEDTVLRLEGQALDDAERPLPGAEVAVGLTTEGQPPPPGLARATGCGDPPAPIHLMGNGQLALRADSDGRFCLRMPLAVLRYRLHVDATWEKERFDAVPLDQELDFGKPPLSLWLEGSDGKADLTKPTWQLAARVGFEDGGRLVHAPGLKVDWLDEHAVVIASAQSDAGGHLRFEVATDKLGDPGVARHRLKSEGSNALGATELTFPLEKRARLELVLETAPSQVNAGVELPYTFRVRIVRNGPADPARQLFAPQALVQASFLDGLVGAAESDLQGSVLVPVLLGAGGQSGQLEFRATARVPFLMPSEPLHVPVEVATPRSWRSLWLLGGFVVLVAWLAIGRAPQRRAAPTARSAAAGKDMIRPPPRAEVRVDEERTIPRWNGNVQDAHDRTPIANAHVRLMRPGFAGLEVLAETHSEPDGSFVLDGSARKPGDRLVIDAPLHRRLDVSAPAFGACTVTTISRRRGLLHDFSRWAQSRPWASSLRRKPTPLDVMAREEASAEWAARVDQVVFGPDEVDAAREASARVPEPSTPIDAK